MEFYQKQTFTFDEDTTDTEDDSGIAEVSEISSSIDYGNEDVLVNVDSDNIDSLVATGHQTQNQDALGRFFSYW